MKRWLGLMVLLLLTGVGSRAQIVNLGQFDSRLLHYGIQVGLTQSKFDLDFDRDTPLTDTLQGVSSFFAPGFHIAVVGDLRLGRWFNLRMIPGVTLITRRLDYSWQADYLENHRLSELSRNVESVYGEVPIELKFRAMRYGNFRPYLTAGGAYAFDFASLRDNKNRTNESIVRLQSSDVRATVGVGADFFLHYVKFAI